MNYAIVYLAGILAFAAVYWVVAGRKFYTGPLIEAEVQIEDSNSDDQPTHKKESEYSGTNDV
jgi:hypothetical protein